MPINLKLNKKELEATITGVDVKENYYETFLALGKWGLLILSYFFGLLGIVYLFAAILPNLDDIERYPVFYKIESIGKLSTEFLRQHIPTKIKNFDIAIYILIVFFLIMKSTMRHISEQLHNKRYLLYFKRRYQAWKNQHHFNTGSAITSNLDKKLNDLEKAKPKDREEILKQFIETKKKLDAMGRDLAFLSIDVVDSTKIKEGEEKAYVEHDFKKFRQYIENILKSNNVLKQVWTPDGVMSCFERVDQAVNSGRQAIIGLENFNLNIKTMKQDFAIRCGVNSGFVYYDENLPLEEIADRVIDIAGHFQKQAKPNSIWIAKPSIEPLGVRDGFKPTTEIVDGYEVYEWKKN